MHRLQAGREEGEGEDVGSTRPTCCLALTQPLPSPYLLSPPSCSPAPVGSPSCRSKELTTVMGLQAGPVVAENRAASSSSRWGDLTSTRPRRTAGDRARHTLIAPTAQDIYIE